MPTPRTPIGSGFGSASTADTVIRGVDPAGKTVVVTGGYSRIELETVGALRSAALCLALWSCGGFAAAATPEGDGAGAGIDAGSQEKAQANENLTGDWGGLRSQLEQQGVTFTLGYKNETAGNLSGGTSRTATSVGQVDLGVTLDLKQILGWDGATVQSSITYRHGPSLNNNAGLNLLEEPQETFGRGQTWRWSELWFRQRLLDDHVIIKVGRLAGGEFANWGCDFTNLGFCGSLVGTANTYFWYNWPIAEWGGLVKLRTDRFYVHVGANEDNARNLDTSFFLGHTEGARGVIEHLEVGWTPAFAGGRLSGFYQVGVWHDTAPHPDVLFDAEGVPTPLSGSPAAEVHEQTGFYAEFEQQLSGDAHLDPVTSILTPTRGLTVGAYYERGDQRTATISDAFTVEARYTAPFQRRTHDEVGVAFGGSTVTSREAQLSDFKTPQLGPQRTEYRSEVFYRASAMHGLFVRPNVQYIINPGGYTGRHAAFIVGVRLDASF